MPRPHEVAAARRDPRLLRAVKEQQGDEAWRIRGACQAVDPETFFPAPTEPADAAVALCRTCDVQGACLAWALNVGDCHGVWGATTPRERRAMLVAWRSEVPGQPAIPPAGGSAEHRLGAVACLPILPIQRVARSSASSSPERADRADPVGAAAK